MFPNPQDALPLPLRPSLEQYKKRAKDLVKACKSSDRDAIRTWAANWLESLADLQGPALTPQLRAWLYDKLDEVEKFARSKLGSSRPGSARCALAGAQFVIARAHGFASWPQFAKHLQGLARAGSPVAKFESAADAIVTGDVATLQRLLRENPALIRARSTREHQATLLHYASANGVESYRQKTPQNIVEVTKILLDAGAEVDAAADVYGGGATTLGLVATSVHPERAGVQDALMQLLLDHNAAIDHQCTVNGCLANGRGAAAEFLARQGARLDIEGAAGVGRLDVVKTFFNKDGSLKANATKAQMERGFLWACEYGRNSVVEFLLQRGVDLNTQANTGQTGLHWAAIGGQSETIKLLLERGASLEVKNVYGGAALGQALWSAVHADGGIDYLPVIEMLLEAGARIEDGSLSWLAQQKGGSSFVKIRIAEVLRRHGTRS
jgi:hypothetical protein